MSPSNPNDPEPTADLAPTRDLAPTDDPVPNPQRLSYLSGQWLPHGELKIQVEDVGFRQGVIAVERLRTYQQNPFALDQHLDRWQLTTEALAIEGLPSRSKTTQLIMDLLRRNAKWIQPRGDVGITMVATPGIGCGVSTLALHLNPLDHPKIDRQRRVGQPLVTTQVVQPDCSSWPRGIKTRARIHYYLADREARRQNPDAVGVLLDQDGSITETSIANLAVVQSGSLQSPPADRVLGGITQRVLETLAAKESLVWEKKPLWPEQLQRADEVLLMGTDGGVWFAHSINGQPVGDGSPGPIYQRLRERFDERVSARSS